MAAIVDTANREAVTAEKLALLRDAMKARQLDAYLIPSVDEHINEYLPENKQRRAWLSGFTGSAGDLLVTLDEAWLFADSRYHEQADQEVALSHIRVSKLGLDGQPALTEKIRDLAGGNDKFRLGFDPFTLSVAQAQNFRKAFEGTGIALTPIPGNLVDTLWRERPADIRAEVYGLSERLTGKSRAEKLNEVRARMKAQNVDVLPLTKLDQVAWLFNLRGQDIPYNPVFTAYSIVTADTALLFMDDGRLQDRESVLQDAVQLKPYTAYADSLASLAIGRTVLVDPKHTTWGTLDIVETAGGRVRETEHPVELLKAVKNEAEIAGMKAANLKASRGKIRVWYWLEQAISAGQTVTEESLKDVIERFYAEEEGFAGLSFNTISGAGANSSIVHYGTPDPAKKLMLGELFLIDSGCQFRGHDFMGTTDDTRTMLVGDRASDSQRVRYTEVMKAHINCAMQRFPKGTEGARLDGICRATLWENGLDYGHGTGHGVGAFLNVHEGPNGIHRLATKALEPGMVNSIEPGYYEPGWGGIRLENLYLTVDLGTDSAGIRWYGFESLIYIPFDKKLIDLERLSDKQLQWLRQYYKTIVEKIGPTLPADEAAWLEALCRI
jgi:Xaa-Pro aminopeptidase